MKMMTCMDGAVEKVVREMESKHNCMIFLLHDDERFYMNVMYADTLETAVEVPMTNIDESKYALATAIRRYFR